MNLHSKNDATIWSLIATFTPKFHKPCLTAFYLFIYFINFTALIRYKLNFLSSCPKKRFYCSDNGTGAFYQKAEMLTFCLNVSQLMHAKLHLVFKVDSLTLYGRPTWLSPVLYCVCVRVCAPIDWCAKDGVCCTCLYHQHEMLLVMLLKTIYEKQRSSKSNGQWKTLHIPSAWAVSHMHILKKQVNNGIISSATVNPTFTASWFTFL